jgi:hypothetical protein
MIAPGEDLVRCGNLREPRARVLVEPTLLPCRIVLGENTVYTVRADIACDNQQIAGGDLREEAVLVAERDDSHGHSRLGLLGTAWITAAGIGSVASRPILSKSN